MAITNINRLVIKNATDSELCSSCTSFKSESDMSDNEFLINELARRLELSNDCYDSLKEGVQNKINNVKKVSQSF